MHALLLNGSGRYADPWHPYARTGEAVAEILSAGGFSVTISDDVDESLRDLTGVRLLVVNAGDPWRGEGADMTPPPASIEGLDGALRAGIGVLALHSAVSSLRDHPEWAPALGAMWVPGCSHHPPADTTTITGDALPDGTSVESFEVFDERYCRLQRLGRSHVVARHHHDGVDEPTAWVRTHLASRIAVDVLGHDERSYAAPGHRALLTQLARWATSAAGDETPMPPPARPPRM